MKAVLFVLACIVGFSYWHYHRPAQVALRAADAERIAAACGSPPLYTHDRSG